MSFIQRLPTGIYVPLLTFSIFILIFMLISNHRNYPKPYNVAFVFIIITEILLILLKLEWLNDIRQLLILLMYIFFISGFSILLISIYFNNKKNGIKFDKTLKIIFNIGAIMGFIGVILIVLALYMKNR